MSSHPLRRLFQLAGRHRRTVLLASACSVTNKVLDLAPPALIGMAVDIVVQREHSLLARWGVVDTGQQLLVLTALTVLIWGLESLFEYAWALLWRNLAQAMQHELRLQAYGHVQELDASWFQERSTGGLLAILNDDINQLERFLDGGANELLQVATTVVVVSVGFFALSPGMAALSLLPIPIILWGSFRFQERIGPRYAAVRARAGEISGLLANNLGGIETIKAFGAEEVELERIRRASAAYQQANGRAIALSSAFSPLIRMAVVLGFIGTLLYGGQLALRGEMAVGSYSVLVFLTQRLLWPLTRLGATFDLYQRAMASTARILDLLQTPRTIRDGQAALPPGGVRGELRLRGVRFAYPGGGEVLRGVDLDLPAGRTVAVVGPTGAGKSSLVRLILRLHDPDAGELLLDGHPLRALRLRELRAQMALVGQSPFLFPGSVEENIAYGSPGASREQIREAARLAQALPFIEALPQGFQTVVGERGQKLSGGQAQRVAIARALLRRAPLLILDEATSAVDNETEAALQAALAEARGLFTFSTLVIAHRLSTIRQADEILVLDQGEVVERGRHEELVARGGLYARLWAVQAGQAGPAWRPESA